MQGNKLFGAILLIMGLFALAYGGFTYTHTEEKAHIGPLHIETQDKDHVNIPVWVGVASAIGGAALLMSRVRD